MYVCIIDMRMMIVLQKYVTVLVIHTVICHGYVKLAHMSRTVRHDA